MKKPVEIFNAAVQEHMRDTGRSYDDARHIMRIANSALWDACEEQFAEERAARLANEAEVKKQQVLRGIRSANQRSDGSARLANETSSATEKPLKRLHNVVEDGLQYHRQIAASGQGNGE